MRAPAAVGRDAELAQVDLFLAELSAAENLQFFANLKSMKKLLFR